MKSSTNPTRTRLTRAVKLINNVTWRIVVYNHKCQCASKGFREAKNENVAPPGLSTVYTIHFGMGQHSQQTVGQHRMFHVI
jgi:hypothetical protein